MDYRTAKPRVVIPCFSVLDQFTVEELTDYMIDIGVKPPRLKLKSHIIHALLESGKARICATLGD